MPAKPKKFNVLYFIINDEDKEIDHFCVKLVEKQLEKITHKDKLFFVIESNGGDPFSAVRIMRIIQEKFTEIVTIVPSHAMSAATLMSLGTNSIYMQHISMLGPLDLPIEHPLDGSRISALDVRKTITTISSLVSAIANSQLEDLRVPKYTEFRLGKVDAAHIAYKYATKLVKPIVSRIDPYHLQKSTRELQIGWRYAEDMLNSRMMKDKPKQAFDTAASFVNEYPAHEYGIFSDEAKSKLKLNIKALNSLAEWKILRPEYDKLVVLTYPVIIYTEIPYATPTTPKKKGKSK